MPVGAGVEDQQRWHRRLRRALPQGSALPEPVWNGRHRAIVALLWAHAIGIPIYGLIRSATLAHVLLEVAVVPLAATVASRPHLSRRVRTIAASVGLLSCSAVLVHLSGGLIEMHFHFFVMVAVVALYQDWIPFLTAIAYVLVHHGVAGAIDPESVFNHPAALAHPWRWAGVHAMFIAGISAACLVSWRLNESLMSKQRAAEERLREETRIVEVLNDVGKALAAELDLETLVQRVTDASTQLTSAAFGAFFYNVVDEDGESYTLYTIAGVDRASFSQFPMPRNTAIFEPTFTGREVVRIDDVRADARYGHSAPYHGMPEGHLPVRSYLAVPVRTRRGEVLGGLFFGHPEPGRFSESDERVVVGIASHAAVAIENARLYESERAAHERSERSRRQLAALAEASRALATSLELDDLLGELAAAVVPAIADTIDIFLVDDAGAIRRAASRLAPHVVEVLQGVDLVTPDLTSAAHPVTRVIRTGTSLLVEQIPSAVIDLVVTESSHRTRLAQLEPISAVVAPILGRGGVVGALAITASTLSGRSLDAQDLQLAEELARRSAVAVENARLFAAQRTTAEILQHSLLPDALPDIAHVTTAARYLPGGPGVDVGGDWYDVAELPDGTLFLTMGDVVGRGVPAASLMGQLRNALRAYVFDGCTPGDALARLNRLLCTMHVETGFATLVVATLDPASGMLRIANGGHPPPLVLFGQGHAEYLEAGNAPPLGAVADAAFEEQSVALLPGSTVLLYTDGLVEDRALSLGAGLEHLLAATATAPRDAEALCDHVLADCLAGRAADDDVAVLAVQWLPASPRCIDDAESRSRASTALDARASTS